MTDAGHAVWLNNRALRRRLPASFLLPLKSGSVFSSDQKHPDLKFPRPFFLFFCFLTQTLLYTNKNIIAHFGLGQCHRHHLFALGVTHFFHMFGAHFLFFLLSFSLSLFRFFCNHLNHKAAMGGRPIAPAACQQASKHAGMLEGNYFPISKTSLAACRGWLSGLPACLPIAAACLTKPT